MDILNGYIFTYWAPCLSLQRLSASVNCPLSQSVCLLDAFPEQGDLQFIILLSNGIWDLFPIRCFWLPAATPYQDLHRWGLDGDVDGVEVSLLDVFHSLYVNIENADEVLCLDIFNSRFTVESWVISIHAYLLKWTDVNAFLAKQIYCCFIKCLLGDSHQYQNPRKNNIIS